MNTQHETPAAKTAGVGGKTRMKSIPATSEINKHHQYRHVGFFRGKGIYLPFPGYPSRSLSIEEDHGGLRALTEEEIFAWKETQFDLALTQRLEEERERAAQAAEDWCSEVGHGLSSGRPHMPVVI